MTKPPVSRAGAIAVIAIAAAILSGCSEEMGAPSFLSKGGSGSGQKFFTPPEEDIVEDEATGLKIAKNAINVHFSPKLDEASIKKIISSINGEIVGYDKSANLYQLRFPGKSLEEVDKIRMRLLAEHKEVEAASRLAVSAHKNPYYAK
ncbi:MAG: hypothetical protein ACNS63_04945 [Candidatus Nitrospinota bacterium M3_3B_026]